MVIDKKTTVPIIAAINPNGMFNDEQTNRTIAEASIPKPASLPPMDNGGIHSLQRVLFQLLCIKKTRNK